MHNSAVFFVVDQVPAPKSTVEALREALRHHPIMFGALPFLMLMFIGFVGEELASHGKNLLSHQCCGDLGCRCNVLLPHAARCDSYDV
jgi:hypothetical protein